MASSSIRDGFTRVLAIDDDGAVLDGYRTGFGRVTEVLAATTGAEAVALARAHAPELVLVDLRLRSEWGGALIPRLRTLLPDATIAVVSAYVSIGSAIAAIRAGADHVIPKPVGVAEILAVVSSDARAYDVDRVPFPSLARVEWEHILRALHECQGNVSQAARLLGIRRTSLQRKLRGGPIKPPAT